MTQPEVRKFTALLTEKAQTGDNQWKLTFQIPELSTNYPTPVTRVPTQDADKIQPKKTYYFSLVKGRLKDGKDASKDYNYFWDWGGMAVEVLPEDAPTNVKPETARPTVTPAPTAPTPDARADSIERQVALKVAGELYVGAMASIQPSVLAVNDTIKESLVLARRLVNYFFGDKS